MYVYNIYIFIYQVCGANRYYESYVKYLANILG